MTQTSQVTRYRRLIAAVVVAFAAGGGFWAYRPRGPVAEATRAYEEGRYRDALRLANDRLRAQADDRDALRISARSSARLGRRDAAVGLFLRLGSEGAQAEDLFLLGDALAALGKPADGENLILDALKLDPAHPESLERLGTLHASADRLVEAAALAERLAKVPGWEARGSLRLGDLRAAQGDHDGAAEAYRRAVEHEGAEPRGATEIDPNRRKLARALLRIGRPTEAEAELRALAAGGAAPGPEVDWLLSRAALQRGDRDAAVEALNRSRSAANAETVPSYAQTEPAPYVGAARCADCHRDVHDDQQTSRHSLTLRKAGDGETVEVPPVVIDDPGGTGVTAEVSGDALTVKAGGETVRAVVEYVLGSGRHARTFVGRDDAGAVRELRWTHYAAIDGWDVTPGHPARPASAGPHAFLGEPQNPDTLRRCLGCHTTNQHAVLSGNVKAPETADHGIGCERCHGPGGNHAAAAELNFPEPALLRFRPGRSGVRARVMEVCGDCHGTEGRQFADANPAATVRFQGTTLTWSRCFVESRGRFDCLSCHDAHGNADEPLSYYDAKCLACHGDGPPSDGAPAPVACPVSPRADCVSCHMPKTKSIVPHATFTDHNVRVHPGDASTQ